MKNLDLTFESRLKITALLGAVTGPLAKIATLQGVWNQSRFDEAETAQIKLVEAGPGLTNYLPPSPDFGAKTIELEDSYAAALLQEIEACQTFRVSDLQWVQAVKQQLEKG